MIPVLVKVQQVFPKVSKLLMSFKKAYIAAFHEMEHRLASHSYKAVLLALVAKEEEREALQAQNQVDGATVTQKGRSTHP